MKFNAQFFWKTIAKHNQNKTSDRNQEHLCSTQILCKEMPESSNVELSEKILAMNFVLSDKESTI